MLNIIFRSHVIIHPGHRRAAVHPNYLLVHTELSDLWCDMLEMGAQLTTRDNKIK